MNGHWTVTNGHRTTLGRSKMNGLNGHWTVFEPFVTGIKKRSWNGTFLGSSVTFCNRSIAVPVSSEAVRCSRWPKTVHTYKFTRNLRSQENAEGPRKFSKSNKVRESLKTSFLVIDSKTKNTERQIFSTLNFQLNVILSQKYVQNLTSKITMRPYNSMWMSRILIFTPL